MAKRNDKTVTVEALSMSHEQIDKNISYIRTASKNVMERLHSTAVAVIIRSMSMNKGGHLDCSLAVPLVASMHDGLRRNALVKWFEEFSNIRITATKDKDKKLVLKARLLGPSDPEYKEASPLQADRVPFWRMDVREGDEALILGDGDFAKALAALVKRYTPTDKRQVQLSAVNNERLKTLADLSRHANENGNKTVMPAAQAAKVVGSTKAKDNEVKGEERSFAAAH